MTCFQTGENAEPKGRVMMVKQNYVSKSDVLRELFVSWRCDAGNQRRLNLSWSNWGFGREPLEESIKRLAQNDIRFIELHGNHYGPDLGYKPSETNRILSDYGVRAAGVCGMFSCDNDLSSPSGVVRQRGIDYIRREVDFAKEVGAGYLLVVPGAVGRAESMDACEFDRSVEALRLVAGRFVEAGVKAAVEPIRAAEVSFCHTVADAKCFIGAVNHPGISHINGDIYHMQSEEAHIGAAILDAGEMLLNLHVADSNRRALGEGAIDVDTIIMALYLIGFNREGCFVTPEPLGPGGNPYPAMYGKTAPESLDRLVSQTASYFRAREAALFEAKE